MKRKTLPKAPHVIGGIDIFFGKLTVDVFNPANGKVLGFTSEFDGSEKYIENSAREAQKCWFYDVEEQEKEAVFRAIIRIR